MMSYRTFRRAVSALAAAGIVTLAHTAAAAQYPLEVTNIRPGMSPGHRLSRAYPGLAYDIRAAVIGGAYPYMFTLVNAPPGMAINHDSGEITWPNPNATATPTMVVVDAEGSRVAVSWTITVTTDGFRFVDAVAGTHAEGNGCSSGCGTGTAESPWRTISDAYLRSRGGEVIYFRTGTYGVLDLPESRVGSDWERVEFNEATRPVIWLAHPGERPVLDFGYKAGVEAGPLIRFTGDNVYIDGLDTANSHVIAFQVVSGTRTGATFRRLRMRAHGPGIDGSNAAFIMTTTDPTPTNYMVIQDCEFSQVTGSAVTIKIYAQQKLLIEDTVHHDTPVAIELKDDVRQFTVRRNRFYDVARTAIGGNMHEVTTHGEILFNYVRAGLALDLNQDGMAGEIHVYRNTFVGRVQVRNTDTADGRFYLVNNVIVNTDGGRDSRVFLSEVSDPSRIRLKDNLAGTPSEKMVDAEGRLIGRYISYIGRCGHELAGSGDRPKP